MCGIVGISGSHSPELLKEMLEAIKHRGPDNTGTWIDADNLISLGHQRLSIIDLSPEANQPMWSNDSRYCIVFNGEIYNFQEIRKDLIHQGFKLKTHSDTEVLLALFQRDGYSMLQSLNGIFAFAIWDSFSRQMFIARDPLGVKPLYYAELPNQIIFSSEIKAILKHPCVSRRIDPKALHNHMMLLWSPQPMTIFQSIKKLEAGEAMIVEKGKIQKKWKYYELPFNGEYSPLSPHEAVEELRLLLAKAVKRQMISDVSIAYMLSGGLDSTSLAALAKPAHGEKQLRAYTIALPQGEQEKDGFADDLHYARIASAALNMDLVEVPANKDMLNSIGDMVYALDEPQADLAALHVSSIASKAREDGYKVLISGVGGDDLFSGYGRHYALLMEKYWSWLPYAVRLFLSKTSKSLPAFTPLLRRVKRVLSNSHLNGQERICAYFLYAAEESIKSLYSSDFKKLLGNYSALTPLQESLERIPNEKDRLNQMLFLDQKFFLTDHNLNYADKMSMLHGVETRVPFLDLDLVRFAAQLNPSFKWRGGTGKWILKQAMAGLIPEKIIYRPKTGFGVSLRTWVSEGVFSVDRWKSSPISYIFQKARLTEALERTSSKREDLSSPLLAIECMSLFFDRHNMYH